MSCLEIILWQDTENVIHFLVCPRRAGYGRIRQFGKPNRTLKNDVPT